MEIRKLAGRWAALALLAGLLTSQIAAAGLPVLVLNDTNAPPYTTHQGDGFLDVVAREAFRRAGVELELVRLPAERGLISANKGVIDGELTRIAGLEKSYPDLLRVPQSLGLWEFVAFGKDPKIFADWATLHSHVVGHITGWKIYEKALQGSPGVVAATGPEQLFELLARGRIDVALYVRWMGQAYVREHHLDDIVQLEPVIARREMFIYLHRKHADRVDAIAQALRDLKQEGFYRRAWDEKVMPYSESRHGQQPH